MNNIILIGNPNVGKTTLFNTLTKSNEKTSNWHGVTVGEKSKCYKFKGSEFKVTDLPGLYSIEGYSNEEKIASNFLMKHKDDLIVNICDANNLKRNLKLTQELLKHNFKVVLAINMASELKNLDYKKLGNMLGVPTIEIDARKTKSVNILKEIILKNIGDKKVQNLVNFAINQLNIDDLLKKIAKYDFDNYKISDKIDKIVLNKFTFIPLFLAVTFLIFYLTFGNVGMAITRLFTKYFNQIFDNLRKLILCINTSNIVKVFLCEAVISSIETVFGFLPQIVLLLFFVNILESVGFMSRVAFMFDGLLKKIGLTGKSVFSLLIGFGCTTSAVVTTRNLENANLRKRTALLLPFMSCTAKLPVFLVIASLFFDKYKYLFVFGLYLFSILLSIIVSLIYKKVLKNKDDLFILEMPKYRLPNLKKIWQDTLMVVKDFLIKVGSTILFFSIIVWILQNFSIKFEFLNGENFTKSMLYFISSKLSFLFKFIGLENPGIISAILLGVVAKEMVIVGLAMINGVTGSIELISSSLLSTSSVCYFTPISSIVFLCFILLYSPCLSAIAMIKNEFGRKTAAYVFVFQFVFAYLISFIVFKVLNNYRYIYILLFFIVLDILLSLVLKLNHKNNKCKGNCNACRKV